MQIRPGSVIKLTGLAGLTALAATGGGAWVGLAAVPLERLLALGAKAAGELAPNIGAQMFIDSANAADGAWARRSPHRNHDIHRLIGRAIAATLEREPRTDAGEAYLKAAADAFRSDPWLDVAADDDATGSNPLTGVSEREVARYFTGNPSDIKAMPTLTVDQWIDVIGSVAGPPPLGSQTATRYAALRLRDDFATELWEAAKRSRQGGDNAWPALVLRLLSELLGHVTRSAEGNAAILAEVTSLKMDITRLVAHLDRPDGQLAVSAEGGATVTALDGYRREISSSLNLLSHLTDTQATLTRQLAGLPEAIAQQLQDAGRPRVADNLAATGATRNLAFVGRAAALYRLTALFADPNGPAAVALVAGAGFGKTELAKAFINLHSPSVDNNPAGWTCRWWLDGSRDGEVKSLREHFATITGQELPPERAVAPGERADDVREGWLETQRRAIAQACSNGRCLLVIDNAETPQQIGHYRPANAGRLLVTTRRQPIPKATAFTLQVDEMSPSDALRMLAGDRPDLTGREHEPALTELAEHVGRHALTLAYVGAAVARPPFRSPSEILRRLQQAEVGDDSHLLGEFDPAEIGTGYMRPLAQSLALLVDELVPGGPAHNPVALLLLELAAFCAPVAIPLEIFEAATNEPRPRIERALRALHERSILLLDHSVSVHRLTQSLVRGRVKRADGDLKRRRTVTLLSGLMAIHHQPADTKEEQVAHLLSPLRTASWPHAEAVIQHVVSDSSLREAELLEKAMTLRADLAWHLADLGQTRAALGHIREAIAWQSRQPEGAARLAQWRALHADIRKRGGDLAGAAEDIGAAIEWAEQQPVRNQRRLSIWYETRAGIRQALDDLAGALDDVERAIAWGEAQGSDEEFLLAWWYGSRARIRHGWGDMAGAARDIARTIAWRASQPNPDYRSLVVDYALRARIRQRIGDLAGAMEDITFALEWRQTQPVRDERSIGYDHAFRARILQDLGDLDRAAADIEYATLRSEAELPRDERALAVWRAWRAGIRQDRGDLEGALADINTVVDWWEAHAPRLDRGLAMWRAARASIRLQRGELTSAADDIAWAIARGRTHRPCDEQRLADWLSIQASISRSRADAATIAGARNEAHRLLRSATADIDAALAWYQSNLPDHVRRLENLRAIRLSLDAGLPST